MGIPIRELETCWEQATSAKRKGKKRKTKEIAISSSGSVVLIHQQARYEASFPALHYTPAIEYPGGCNSVNVHHILAADR